MSSPVLKDFSTLYASEYDVNVVDGRSIRNGILKSETILGNSLMKTIDNGEMMSDEQMLDMYSSQMDLTKNNLIYEFPKNIKQLSLLERYMSEQELNIDKIVYFKVLDLNKTFNYAREKYGKVYDDIEIFAKRLSEYKSNRVKLFEILKLKYDFEEVDILTEENEIKKATNII